MPSPTFLYGVAFVAWALLLAPSIVHLFSGWTLRRSRLWDFLTKDILKPYYELFYPSEIQLHKDIDFVSHFRRRFNQRYGRRHYVLPGVLLAATSGLGLWSTAESVIGVTTGSERAVRLPTIAVSAILGAYVWVVGDQLSRLRNRDFTMHDVYACSFRMIIAVPLGMSLAALLQEQAGPPIAFLLGAFPTQALLKLARRRAGQQLGLEEGLEEGPTELVKLQGVSRAVAERFQEEGITTISQLAWTEPVDLTIRTNFDFDFVLDCQSQALLWSYFQESTRKLFPFMMRGAMEVAEMLGRPLHGGPNIELAPVSTLKAAAVELGMDANVLGETFLEVARDPYTQVLCSIWYPKWLMETEEKRNAASARPESDGANPPHQDSGMDDTLPRNASRTNARTFHTSKPSERANPEDHSQTLRK